LLLFTRDLYQMATTTTKQSVTVRDISAPAFIKAYAAHLKKTNWLKVPDWVDIVKTAHFKELCPSDPDWFYVRTASVARKIYLRGGTGIGALKKVYGGSNRRGPRPPVFCKGSGKIARYIVQQLRQIGVVEDLVIAGKIHGRKISREGQKDLDRIAKSVSNAANNPASKKKSKKPAAQKPAVVTTTTSTPAETKPAPAKGGEGKGGAEKAPAKGGAEKAPAKGGEGKGGAEKAPAKGGAEKAPAKGGEAKGGAEKAPAKGGKGGAAEKAPAKGGKGGVTEDAPAKGGAEEKTEKTPAEKAPAKGGKGGQQSGKGGAKK